jgi:hypothetical protein
MWGNPTREREIYYSAFRKVQNSTTISHLQPRKIPHNTKTVPQKSASFFVPKRYCCTTCSVPQFSCPQSAVRTVLYGPETTTRILKSASKIVPKNVSISVPNPYGCTDCTETNRLYRFEQYSLPQQKINSAQKRTEKFSRDTCLRSLENMPSCFSLSSLKHT